ncbi:hypothetical protein [Paenibacillus daejeonensis]|uniref:hypothetical protein n=1 Tax=Paenibacillus daejeonensis TaxID=135193 RepID=UPI000366B682|nr:hypothetical protein [Paenibacillus daejeonensis]
MKLGHLIIAAREPEYIQRLTSYMRDVPFGAAWQVTAFTHPPAMKQYLKNSYPADLVLAQPDFIEEAGELMPSDAVVAELVRQRRGESGAELLQFQPLPELLRQLTQLYREASGSIAEPTQLKGAPLIVSVYSAAAGIGKTTLALHLVRAAAMQRKKVFYLNLEQWHGAGSLFGDQPDDSFSRMLYSLQAQPDQAQVRLRELRKQHGVLQCDTFAPPQGPGERRALTGAVAASLLGAIRGSGEYELIVVDMDTWMDDVHEQVTSASQLLLWLWSDDAAVRGKTQYGLEQARKRGGELLQNRLRMIRIGEQERPASGSGQPDSQGILPVIPQWLGPQAAPVPFASPQYRQAVDHLMHQLVYPEGGDELDRSRGGGAWAEAPYSRAH